MKRTGLVVIRSRLGAWLDPLKQSAWDPPVYFTDDINGSDTMGVDGWARNRRRAIRMPYEQARAILRAGRITTDDERAFMFGEARIVHLTRGKSKATEQRQRADKAEAALDQLRKAARAYAISSMDIAATTDARIARFEAFCKEISP